MCSRGWQDSPTPITLRHGCDEDRTRSPVAHPAPVCRVVLQSFPVEVVMAYVKCGSHRAREKLSRLCDPVPRMVWPDGKHPIHGYEIPDDVLPAALGIKMVTRWRIPKGERIGNPWSMR